jgi:prevent-host-death family protein
MEHYRMDITQDIQALTTFRNHSAAFLQHLKKTQRPVVLTVNGKAAAVVQDAAAYQRLLDLAAQADAVEGIRQGREDVAKGRTRPARDFLSAFRREHGLPG